MVRDAVPQKDAYGKSFFSNSYSILASRIDYTWDSETNKINSSKGIKYFMRLGLGTRTITGVNARNPYDSPVPGTVKSASYPLELSAAEKRLPTGSYNIYDHYTNSSLLPISASDHLTTINITMKKTNTGFEAYYMDEKGNKTSEIMYDWQQYYLADGNVYVGLAVGRNMDVTVSNLNFSYTNAIDDEPAKERPIKEIEPIYTVTSSKETGVADYSLRFKANADGHLTIKNRLTDQNVQGAEKRLVKAGKEISISTVLVNGKNPFDFIFTPDPNYPPDEHSILSDYSTKTIAHTVIYKTYPSSTIYVTPEARLDGNGSQENPLPLTEALKFARAGQTIIMASGKYHYDKEITIAKEVKGNEQTPITLTADKEQKDVRPIIDFNKKGSGLSLWGDYWILQGIDITNSLNDTAGMKIAGHHNWIENIKVYHNGGTGLQISGSSIDTKKQWPSYNTIKNCTAFENYDAGFENADGFGAKLMVGEGNIFDGCISYHNADDGFDFFAKPESGSISKVTLKNCVAYRNGYIPGLNGKDSGNGFKMGGSSLSGKHGMYNCLAFENASKGIDSNSCPDIKIQTSTSFNNGASNVALYAGPDKITDFKAFGILSYRTKQLEVEETMNLVGNVPGTNDVFGPTNYYWDTNRKGSINCQGKQIKSEWIQSVKVDEESNLESEQPIQRYKNGNINVNGIMQIKRDIADLSNNIGATFIESMPINNEISSKN